MQGNLILHDVATIQIAEPEKVKKGATGEYTVQTTRIIDVAGETFEIKCFMAAEATGAEGQEPPRVKAQEAIRHTQDRMDQLRAAMKALPQDERDRLLRIGELVDMIGQGLDTIESALYLPEAKE